MSTLNLLDIYPEQSPFDLDPPPYNLTPDPPDITVDTPEFRAAAGEVERLYDPRLVMADRPFEAYQKPPALGKVDTPHERVFLEQINPNGNTPIFVVRVGEDVRVLKVFRDRPTPLHDGYRKPEEAPAHPLRRFVREKEAYEHLLHYGGCAKGAVPHCYGWHELSADDMDNILSLPDISDDLKTLKNDDGPPKALMLEYFEGAQRTSVDNVTETIADAAVRAMCSIHASYVLHSDTSGRNLLFFPSGRVVWIDFDRAATVHDEYPVRRQDLLGELSSVWAYLYEGLLPDKRIGFRHWLY